MLRPGQVLSALGLAEKRKTNAPLARQAKRSKNNRHILHTSRVAKEKGPDDSTDIPEWSPNDELEGWELDPADLVDEECGISPVVGRRYVSSDDPMREWVPYKGTYLNEILRLEGQTPDARAGRCATCCRKAAAGEKDAGGREETGGEQTKGKQALYRCHDCFGDRNECLECSLERHKDLPLHWIEKWNGHCFERITLQEMGLRVQVGHSGGTCPVPEAAPRVFTVLHVNGLHRVNVDFCNCHQRLPRQYQLLRQRWYPATVKLPATCATFELLRHFHGLSLCSKISAHEYYLNLERLTNNSGHGVPKTRYRAFLRMVRQFRHLRMLKRAGRGHIKDGVVKIEEGALALDCAACPLEGVNLPKDWITTTSVALMFLYTLFLSIDANFRLKNRLRNADSVDPGLHTGLAYFVPQAPYNTHILEHATEADLSSCSSFSAIARADSKSTTGLRSTGVGMCVCSRHEMIRRSGVGDLQKGERYCNMDFIFLSALCGGVIHRIMIIYDIACQWKVNFPTRMSALPESMQIPPTTTIDYAIPKCHLPAHQVACQAPNSLNLKPGVGRTDGEGIERDWSMLNAAANSTREMGLGSRHDTLDDLFAYHNWQKTTGLGLSLRRKYILASVESRRHKLLHEEFCESIPQAVQAKWTRMITDWEVDKSKPNPYEVEKTAYETEADIKRRLLEHEASENVDTEDGQEGISEAMWLSSGLVIEDTQRKLRHEYSDQTLTSVQATSLLQKRLLLKRQIKTFRQQQQSHIRASNTLVDTTSPSLSSEPEHAKLGLPSELSVSVRTSRCSASLIRKEAQLRVAQCDDALERIRLTQRAKRHVVIHKRKNVTGQRASAKVHLEFERLELKIKQAADKYCAARTALRELVGEADIPPHLMVLKKGDVCPPPAFDVDTVRPTTMRQAATQLGEGAREVPWIWRAPGVFDDTDAALNAGLRIEWAKSRARSLRWTEEVLLVKEEMRRVRQTLQYRAEQWRERANFPSSGSLPPSSLRDPTLLQGISAYAHRQRLINERLRASFSATWEKPPGKRSKLAGSDIPPPNIQDAVTASDETLMSDLLAEIQDADEDRDDPEGDDD